MKQNIPMNAVIYSGNWDKFGNRLINDEIYIVERWIVL